MNMNITRLVIAVIALIAMSIIAYHYLNADEVDVILVSAIEDPKKDRLQPYPNDKEEIINSIEHFNWYMDHLSLPTYCAERIKQSLHLDKYDYIVTCNYKIIECHKYHDGICECEDNRIALKVDLSEHSSDSIYVYRLDAKKNKYRNLGP